MYWLVIIVLCLIIAFLVMYISSIKCPQPNYNVYYRPENRIKSGTNGRPKGRPNGRPNGRPKDGAREGTLTDSVSLGGHNSSHTSTIRASAF